MLIATGVRMKHIVSVGLLVISLLAFVGCNKNTEIQDIQEEGEVIAISVNDIIGTWFYEKDNIKVIYTFNDDGTFHLKTGDKESSGSYKIKDGNIILERESEPSEDLPYKVEENTLTVGIVSYTRYIGE